jgi:transcription initiation factor TFIIIB Brf1 subunit/transcription initiation factor TFIIB
MYPTINRWLPPPDPSGPVTCAICGCRLEAAESDRDYGWRHFSSLHPGQDARGCRTVCSDELHDRDGRMLSGATLRWES